MARLKDIYVKSYDFTGVTGGLYTIGIVPLTGAYSFSLQFNHDLPGSQTSRLYTGVAAQAQIGDILYTAEGRSSASDAISVELISDVTAPDPITIDLNAATNAVVIHTDSSAGGYDATTVANAVNGTPVVNDVISAAVNGTALNVQQPGFAYLAGGIDSGVDLTTNSFLIPNHPYVTDLPVQIDINAGGPPTPLALLTTYYVIALDQNNIQFAAAPGGAPIVLTYQGTPGEFLTVIPDIGPGSGDVFINASNDGVNWAAVLGPIGYAAAGTTLGSVPDLSYKYLQIQISVTADTIGDLELLVKGYD